MFLGFHAQSGDAGRLAVRVHVQIVAVDAGAHAWTSEQAAHVALSHVTSGTWHAQEVRHTAGSMGVRGHAGSHRVTRNNAAWHRGRCAAPADPRGILDLNDATERKHMFVLLLRL